MSTPNKDTTTPVNDNVQHSPMSSDDVSRLLAALEAEREEKRKLTEKVDILYRSVDHNAIRKNTPKDKRNPLFRVNLFDGKPVMRWDAMTHNKVSPSPHGTLVEQTVRFYYADDTKGTEMNYADFHAYRTQVEVEAIEVIDDPKDISELNPHGRSYKFEYGGELYIINILFIN